MSGQRLGYVRVSTDTQQMHMQLDALRAAGVAEGQVYCDTASGKTAARPQLEACLKALRAGDTLVIWRLDRLGRSLPDLISLGRALEDKGVALLSLSENLETASAAGRLVFHVFAALAEFERHLIRERTQAGLAAARARGRKGGRKEKLTPAQVKEVQCLMADPQIAVAQIAQRYRVSRSTLYKVAARRATP